MNTIKALAEAICTAKHAVVLTGAGASTDSGLPDFRSKAGLWQGVDPMKLASLTALRRNPVEFYQFYRDRLSRLRGARPNPVHLGLAALQQAGYVKEMITQNIDELHQAAGAREVVEMHGNLKVCVCLQCHRQFSSDLLEVDVTTEVDIPRCPECRGALKPGVILFEEALPANAFDRAFQAARQADLFLVIGSSLEVGPVNQLPAIAAMEGARLAIVNLEPTHLDSQAEWVIRERAAQVVENCCRYLGVAIPPVEL